MAAHAVVLSIDGSAVASADGTRAVARQLAELQDTGRGVVAVLPAMGEAADDLVALAHAVSPSPHPRELDMLVTTGARIACALCAMALIDEGRDAVSLTGSQAGIVTDTRHGAATIVDVQPARILDELATGAIVLVAALQGVSTEAEVTTLAGGRVEAAAAAIAAALGAELVRTGSEVDAVR